MMVSSSAMTMQYILIDLKFQEIFSSKKFQSLFEAFPDANDDTLS